MIGQTSIFQGDRVQEMRTFISSMVHFSNEEVNAEGTKTSVSITLSFQTNIPLWKGSQIYLRLPGFSAEITQIPLRGPFNCPPTTVIDTTRDQGCPLLVGGNYLQNQVAVFDLAKNEVNLRIARTLYSQPPNMIQIVFDEVQK